MRSREQCRLRAETSTPRRDVLGFHFPGAVAAVRATCTDEDALAAFALVSLESPVQPGQIDFREVATARAAQVTAVPDVLAEEHDRQTEPADIVVIPFAILMGDVARAAEDDQHGRVHGFVERLVPF